ncbi:predicted protein [Naegleria gruberi]|uniref:Predicted protein n=1 Tax=Naegleria gruberi TaxID=5762 RepID=D2VF51_NAEGR|nr:uncharacterized protein NAEGRDRAFT_67502 [Naegleria gruberi]EFC44622.1 predicted protein [Naegleria gruberi]|eukprot:XP_002677366.1 predicted protein [Naegleria gruberi strain NEG-M]
MRNYLMEQKKNQRIYVQKSTLRLAKKVLKSLPNMKFTLLADSDNFTFAKLLLTCLSTGEFVSDSSQLIQYLYRDSFKILSDSKAKSVEIPSLEIRLDSLENSNEELKVSPVEYTFDGSCFVVLFNRLDRENFTSATNNALRYVRNHSFNEKPIILIGFNWCRFFLNYSYMKTHFMHQRVLKHSKDFVSNDEILSFCQKHSNVIGYIDAKPSKERDISDILMKLVSLSMLSKRINCLSDLETSSLCLY